jgi:thymidine phosphorylase
MGTPTAVEVIAAKRDRHALTDQQIDWMVAGYTTGEVAEEQMSALLMAILLNGMTRAEIARWTAAMVASGERLDLSGIGRPTVDKHSTGGVGDKISLPLVPLVAACGAAVPQLSGRGLGHTGGTLDKMESIAGWNPLLDNAEFRTMLAEIGGVICAASADLAPADRKLYALRDVTATVESVPMIAASIMSKKIAEGTDALVLDVKVGTGAFMKSQELATELARTMVDLGAANGVRTTALLTDMNTPLGLAVGNAVEVAESVDVLAGGGPADVVELTLALAREMVAAAGLDADPAQVLASGRAMDVWRTMVTAQGGDPGAALPTPRERQLVTADRAGTVTRLDALAVGTAAWRLGAGRARKEDPVQAAAGVLIHAKPGDRVAVGDLLLELHTDTADRIPDALAALDGAFDIGDAAPGDHPLVLDVIRG